MATAKTKTARTMLFVAVEESIPESQVGGHTEVATVALLGAGWLGGEDDAGCRPWLAASNRSNAASGATADFGRGR